MFCNARITPTNERIWVATVAGLAATRACLHVCLELLTQLLPLLRAHRADVQARLRALRRLALHRLALRRTTLPLEEELARVDAAAEPLPPLAPPRVPPETRRAKAALAGAFLPPFFAGVAAAAAGAAAAAAPFCLARLLKRR